jgi:hypothetical protein
MFRGLDDNAAARHEQCLCQLDELAAKELEMLIDGSDESTSGQASDNEADIADMVSVHMGGSELESEGGNGENEEDEEDSPKLKVKGKGQAKKQAKVRTSHTTSLPIKKVQQGKVSSYQTAESFKVCHIPLAR